MNKLDTSFNGGYPIELDDFRFLDDIYRTGIHQVMQSLSSFAILTGCDGGGYDVNGDILNAGWLVVNGEIGYLPQTFGLDLDPLSASYGIIADNYVDNSVIKILQTGQSVKPHVIRQFKLMPYQPSMGEGIRFKNIKPLKETIKTEFGLDGQLKQSTISFTPSTFIWNSIYNRWESVNPHGLSIDHYSTKGISLLIEDMTRNVLSPLIGAYLMDNFSYEFNGLNVTITDNSSQASSSQSRSFLENNGIKVIFNHS